MKNEKKEKKREKKRKKEKKPLENNLFFHLKNKFISSADILAFDNKRQIFVSDNCVNVSPSKSTSFNLSAYCPKMEC